MLLFSQEQLCLEISKEVGDKALEGNSYGSLGKIYIKLGDFKKALEYLDGHLNIAKEVGGTMSRTRRCVSGA